MNKLRKSIGLAIFMFLLVACNNVNPKESKIPINSIETVDASVKYAQIVDTLDLKGNRTFTEVLKDPDSKKYYHDAYNKLINNKDIHFLETAIQIVEYNNTWRKGFEFVDGSNGENDEYIEDFINQEVQIEGKKFTITPLKTLVVGESIDDYLKLSSQIIKGSYFSKEDYLMPTNDKINVVLGSSYQELFKIGDTFDFFYLGVNFNANVIGFINKGIRIPASGRLVIVDNYIIFPSFNVNLESNDLKRYTQHYSTKVAGSILYKTNNELKLVKDEIENVFKPYDLPYTIIETSNTKIE
ncbi:MAG TPA: hypothetical protein GXZ90_10390 [Clostridiales bacterium]|nr:hypothetical protein [Clostridiales bacterium]